MALHAELHRHLGGSVVPRIFWRYLVRHDHPLARVYPTYEEFEEFFTRPRASLTEYLELHTLVEQVQALENLPYFVAKLVRGAYVFESIAYLELRHTPYLRTNPALGEAERIAQMRQVVEVIAEASELADYPVMVRQILCMHSRLPYRVNRAMVELAAAMPGQVCAVDLAGPDVLYRERLGEFVELFRRARSLGLRTTAHLFETEQGCHPELLPYLDRIGHGVQIPLRYPELLDQLAKRGQCLEICPTTYLKTGTLKHLGELRLVFERCQAAGVAVTLNTDNAGLHNVRLPWEYENLLTHDVIDFVQLRACQDAAFQYAFAWPYPMPPRELLQRAAEMVGPEASASTAEAPRAL
ncbi:MAG: adenosine deaminase [Armatimonadota bacterium]|nr:adenosine deaminase [Armatimonadota bacterium]